MLGTHVSVSRNFNKADHPWHKLKTQERKIVKQAVKKSMQEYVDLSKSMIPVDTGNLLGSVVAYPNKERTSWKLFWGGDGEDERIDAIKTNTLEFGRSNGDKGVIIAYRFIREPAMRLALRHRRRVNRALKKAIKMSFDNAK